jgi:cbb3-type cytochrome oxidase subunit 3
MTVLAISVGGILVLLLVIAVLAWVFWVALRAQRQREATGGRDPDQDSPEPAPDRRETPGDSPG